MIVVDSSALIAILRHDPEADSFLQVIAAADRCLLSAVSFLDTSMVPAGRSGDASSWIERDALMARAGILEAGHAIRWHGGTHYELDHVVVRADRRRWNSSHC